MRQSFKNYYFKWMILNNINYKFNICSNILLFNFNSKVYKIN